eukprot:g31269.t1
MEGVGSGTAAPICPGKVTNSKVEGVICDGKPQLPVAAAKNSRSQNSRAQRRRAATDCATQEDDRRPLLSGRFCHPRKIFIGGLAHKTTTQHLRDYFVKYGGIVDAVVLRWPDGRSRGFGYVTFSEELPLTGKAQGAQGALNDAHQIGGRQVDVKRAVPGTNKLFVGGLPQNTTAAELREHFEAFGTVSDAVVMIDPATNRSRGFGFVCFLPGQEATGRLVEYHLACPKYIHLVATRYEHHRIRGKWIEVKSAAPPHKLAKDAASSPSASEGPYPMSSAAASPTASPSAGSSQASPHIMSLTQALKVPLAAPQAQERPVASPQNRNSRVLRSLTLVGPDKAALEPQKVMLPGAVGSPPGLGATAAAALAAMRAMGPPGLVDEEEVEDDQFVGWEASAAESKPQIVSTATVFSNSNEFQRTLEQLLRLQAETADASPSM